jgi:hypothetical protein
MTTTDTPAPDRRLDGNALAGPLLELFTVDLSGAMATCVHCDITAPLGEQQLYADAPALVLRCRDCTGVLLRYSADSHGTGSGTVRADLSGLRLLVAHLPAAGASR